MTAKFISFLGWSIVLIVSLYFVYNNALHYFRYNSTEYGPDAWPRFAPTLLIHIIAGILALLLGPFQFIPAIRNNYPKVHHTIGKTYLISIVIGAIASLNLSINKVMITEKALVFGLGLFGLAVAWLLTSGMAYWSVRKKDFDQHREWMVRSYVVTTAFASFRLFDKILSEKLHTDPAATGEVMAWACWAFPLMITEAFLQGIKIRRGAIERRKKPEDPLLSGQS